MRRTWALGLVWILAGGVAAGAGGPPPMRDPGAAAFALANLASERGLSMDLVEVAWDADAGHLVARLEATPLPLGQLTPFLFMAAGPTEITRIEGGRRVVFPLACPDFAPRPSQPDLRRLADLLGNPFMRQRRLVWDPGRATRTLHLAARLPDDLARRLLAGTSELLGPGALTRVALEGISAEGVRLVLEGPGVPAETPGDAASPGSTPRVRRAPTWAAAAASLAAAPGTSVTLSETDSGEVVVTLR